MEIPEIDKPFFDPPNVVITQLMKDLIDRSIEIGTCLFETEYNKLGTIGKIQAIRYVKYHSAICIGHTNGTGSGGDGTVSMIKFYEDTMKLLTFDWMNWSLDGLFSYFCSQNNDHVETEQSYRKLIIIA
jgi:hypothetical protein